MKLLSKCYKNIIYNIRHFQLDNDDKEWPKLYSKAKNNIFWSVVTEKHASWKNNASVSLYWDIGLK